MAIYIQYRYLLSSTHIFLYSRLLELFCIAYAAGHKAYCGCIAVLLCKYRFVYYAHNTYKKI